MITPAILIVHRGDVSLSLIGYCWLLLPNKVTDWLKNYKLTDGLSYLHPDNILYLHVQIQKSLLFFGLK